MRPIIAFCIGLAVFSFVIVCEGTTTNDDVQEVNGKLSAYTTDLDINSDEMESLAEEIEKDMEEDIAESTASVNAFKSSLPLMFPSLLKAGKTNRKMNMDMAVKLASIIEQAVMLVANDILQTSVLLQTNPQDFLQELTANTTSTSE